MKSYTCDGQMSIFDILGQEPAKPKQQGYDYSNPILNHMLEELKEIFTVTEIKYEVWDHVPNLGKRMNATLKDIPDVWDITEMMDRYLKDYELELSTTIWDPLSGEKEIWLSTMWTTKGHKERTDWKEEPKKIKLPLSMKYCSIIGADCACHDEKGCKYPEKCGLLKEVAENNNLEREEKLAAVQEKQRLREKYPIPELEEKYRVEERWVDDWHYCDEELPKEHGVYYCIQAAKERYNYTYMAYAYGQWWNYAGYGTTWLLVRGERREWMRPFAWVKVPDKYYQEDTHYQFLTENFVTEKDWEYEKRMMQIREENKRLIEEAKKKA